MPDSFIFEVADSASTLLGMMLQAAGDVAGDAVSTPDALSAAEDAANLPAAGEGVNAADELSLPLRILRNPLLLPVGLFLMFYLLVLMPERKKQAEAARRRSEIKKNDRVIMASGIYGTVVGVTSDSDEIQLRIDDSNNTKIRVTRGSIATVLTPTKDDSTSKND